MVVTDETPDTVITVAERMQRAGIAADRARRYNLVSSAVLLDGQRVTDPDTPAPPPARIVLLPA